MANTPYRKQPPKAITTFAKPIFLRKRQSRAPPLCHTRCGQVEDRAAVRAEHRAHCISRLFLLGLLRVAVGTLQESRVAVAHQIGHRLLVHAAVEQRSHEVVAQGVEVVFPGEADGVIDLPQPLGEGVGMDELPVFVGEEVGAELAVARSASIFLRWR